MSHGHVFDSGLALKQASILLTCPIGNIEYCTDRSRSELILQNCISVASKVCRIENYIKGATCLLLFLIVSASRSKAY